MGIENRSNPTSSLQLPVVFALASYQQSTGSVSTGLRCQGLGRGLRDRLVVEQQAGDVVARPRFRKSKTSLCFSGDFFIELSRVFYVFSCFFLLFW